MITRSSKSNRVLVLTIFLAGLLMSMIVSAEEKFKVRVGDFYPNYFRDSQGVWQGVDIELARALMERAKIDYEFVNIDEVLFDEDKKEGVWPHASLAL